MTNNYNYQKIISRRNDNKIKGISLTDEEQLKLVKHFTNKIIRFSDLEFIIKDCHIGYRIFHSVQDKKYWTKAIIFDEPFNPKKPIFNTKWLGNSNVSYGFNNIDEMIEKTSQMMVMGLSARPPIGDYLVDWDEKTQRIYIDTKERIFNYQEYLAFQKWFSKNKIRIMSKKKGVKYFEDYKHEEKNPMAVLMLKSQEPPQRPKPMAVLIQEKKYSKSTDYSDVEKKKYIIGFYMVHGGF